MLLGLVTLQGSASALIGPFSQAILPDLVPRSEFLAASSLNSAQWNAGRIVGPALAGATVAAFGFAASFVANAVSFLAVVVALLFVRLAPPPGSQDGLFRSMRAGLRAAWAQPSCRAATIAIGTVALLAAPFIALVPAVALSLTHGGATSVAAATAALTTAQGLGAVAGALLLPPLAVRIRPWPDAGLEPGAAARHAHRLRRRPVAVAGRRGAVRRRACLHGRAVGPADRRAAACARRLPRPGAQLLPRRARRGLSAWRAGSGPGRRPHRRGLDDGRPRR